MPVPPAAPLGSVPGTVAPPLAPAQVYRYPASTPQAVIRSIFGALLIVAGIVTAVFGSMFPYNAPIESFMNFGLIAVLCGAGVTLLIFASLTVNRMSRPTIPGRTSPLAITGLSLNAVTLLIWAVFTAPVIGALAAGDGLRYMTMAGAVFFLGFVWSTGTVLSVMSLRAVGGATRVLAAISLVIGMILVAAAVTPAVIYGLGLSN